MFVPRSPPASSLHGNAAHVRLLAALRKREIALGGYVAERELHRLEPAARDARLGDVDAVGRHADVTYPAAALRLQRARHRPVGIVRVGHARDLMELKEVDIICFHHAEAVFDMRKYTGLVLRGALCGQHDLIAHIGEGETYLLLTVGVGVRGVEKT